MKMYAPCPLSSVAEKQPPFFMSHFLKYQGKNKTIRTFHRLDFSLWKVLGALYSNDEYWGNGHLVLFCECSDLSVRTHH